MILSPSANDICGMKEKEMWKRVKGGEKENNGNVASLGASLSITL